MNRRLLPSRAAVRVPVTLAAAVIMSAVAPGLAHSQEVTFTPRKGSSVDRRLAEFVDGADWILWSGDTVVARDGVVPGNVLILSAVARVAGRVDGHVYVVDGDLFLRPGALIAGDVVILGGGYYGSGMATVEGEVVWKPSDRFSVIPSAGGLEIRAVEEPAPWLELHGLDGFEAPTYQRVDALTLGWGARLRATGWPWQPTLDGSLRFRTGQGEFEGSVKQFWHPGPVEFGVEGERATRTNDDWIRGGVSNSLSYLFAGDDFREYYQADRAAFVVRGRSGSRWTPEVRLEWEKAKSRLAGGHFTFFGSDAARPNPAIDDGEDWSTSVALSLDADTGARARLTGRAMLQVADSSVAGDFSYVLGELQARWTTPGFAAHEVDLFALMRGDLSGEPPGQRWAGFGGRTTLPTYDVMEIRGPRVIYGQAGYAIPLRSLEAGPLGAPAVFGRVAGGAAWRSGDSADFRTNLIGGVTFWLLEGGVAFDPDAGDVRAYATLRFPGDL